MPRRARSDQLSRVLRQQFVVETGVVLLALAIEAVIKSPPDGYTFLATPSLSVVIPASAQSRTIRRIRVPSSFVDGTLLAAVHHHPANSIKEFVAYAKQNPQNSTGAPGVGTYGHLIYQTFRAERVSTFSTCPTGAPARHCPISGGRLPRLLRPGYLAACRGRQGKAPCGA